MRVTGVLNKIPKFLCRYIYPFFVKIFFPVDRRKVVFVSYYGRQYSDNPRAISEKLHQLDPSMKIVWLLRDPNHDGVPRYVKKVKYESLKSAYELYTAGTWVDNCRKPIVHGRKENQIYIQTWHGTQFKKIEADAEEKLTKRYVKYAKRDSKNITHLLSGNRYATEKLRAAFWYDGEVVECGNARNDRLITERHIASQELREKIGVSTDDLTVLYAPTFRDDMAKNGAALLDRLHLPELVQMLEEKFQKSCRVLLRFHSNIEKDLDVESIQSKYNCIYLSGKWDTTDVLCATDILITDYSSILFDFALAEKPILLFAPDISEYMNERGLYMDPRQLGLPYAESFEQLREIVRQESFESLCLKTKNLLKIIGNKETGQASEYVARMIIRHAGAGK